MAKKDKAAGVVGEVGGELGHLRIVQNAAGDQPAYVCDLCSFSHLDHQRAVEKVRWCKDGCNKEVVDGG